jgi:hypothetical protein
MDTLDEFAPVGRIRHQGNSDPVKRRVRTGALHGTWQTKL